MIFTNSTYSRYPQPPSPLIYFILKNKKTYFGWTFHPNPTPNPSFKLYNHKNQNWKLSKKIRSTYAHLNFFSSFYNPKHTHTHTHTQTYDKAYNILFFIFTFPSHFFQNCLSFLWVAMNNHPLYLQNLEPPFPHQYFHGSHFPPKVSHHHFHIILFSFSKITFTKSWRKWKILTKVLRKLLIWPPPLHLPNVNPLLYLTMLAFLLV